MYGTPKIAGITLPGTDVLGRPYGDDFFHDQSGGLLGGKVGIELLYTDLYVQFNQFFNDTGAAGSTVQLMLGWDGSFGCRATPCWAGVVGIYGGGIFGFPYTPHPPIDKGQLATYGLGAEAQFGAEYNFNRYFVFQALGTVGYHYLFKGSDGFTVDNSGSVTYSATHGFHFLATAGFRFHLYAL